MGDQGPENGPGTVRSKAGQMVPARAVWRRSRPHGVGAVLSCDPAHTSYTRGSAGVRRPPCGPLRTIADHFCSGWPLDLWRSRRCRSRGTPRAARFPRLLEPGRAQLCARGMPPRTGDGYTSPKTSVVPPCELEQQDDAVPSRMRPARRRSSRIRPQPVTRSGCVCSYGAPFLLTGCPRPYPPMWRPRSGERGVARGSRRAVGRSGGVRSSGSGRAH